MNPIAAAKTEPDHRPEPYSPAPHRFIVRLAAVLAVPLMLALVVAPSSAHARLRPAAPAHGCVERDVTVTLTDDAGAASYKLAGWLCRPRSQTRTVQLAVPGLTYSHRYWTGDGRHRSYVDAALAAGDAVYAIDRIGIGASGRPPAAQVTVQSEAHVIHQLVQALRHGLLGHYDTVAGVGHSYGSVLWMAEAARYHDTDALVLTGLLHDIDTAAMTAFVAAMYPAADDPAFTAEAPFDGYLTTRPGTRAGFFLYPPAATPGAADWDERVKATATTGELTFSPADELSYSLQLQVPVLLIVGDRDALFCGDGLPCGTGTELCHREHDDFAPGAALFAATIPDAGHSINLHRSADRQYTIANTWIADHTHRPGRAGADRQVVSC